MPHVGTAVPFCFFSIGTDFLRGLLTKEKKNATIRCVGRKVPTERRYTVLKRLLALLLALLFILLCSCQGPLAGGGDTGGDALEAVDPSAHADANDDGYCDDCGGYLIIALDLYAINDLHGVFDDSGSNEGVDELTTYLRAALRSNARTLLLASGDMWQGSSESNLTKGQIITDWMNALDFSAMTLGNHEFDWGEDAVEENAELAEFPFLAINIFERDTHEAVDYCEPSVLIECGGVQVGIIGAIGDCYSSISGDKVEEIYFKTGDALTELVKAESERLRAEGADLIVYSLHDGYARSGSGSLSDGELSSYYDPELSEGGYVDLVLEGHTHADYARRDTHGVYHVQNGGYNSAISHVEIMLNYVTNSFRVRAAETVDVRTMQGLSDDPLVDELLEKYADELAIASRVVGENARRRDGNTMRQKVAELYLEAGLEKWGEEYDIVLGGGFISIRNPGYLAAGEVTYSMLQSLFPFDNELVLCSIRGSDLISRFLETDNGSYFIACDPYLRQEIEPSATYYIIVDSYSSSYAPNRLTEIARYGEELYARDLLAAFIGNGGFAD